MQQDDPWSLETAGKREGAETPQPTSLAEALLALDWSEGPVFAVLDGAQFDNLPQDLMMGGFVSRPLYLDRGDNNPEQIITAPHMVWLDERGENVTGRAPKDTIPALLDLIADRPAAVFWQCPEGGEALYKHLRGINMVMYPKAAIADWQEPEPAEGEEVTPPDTHTLVLFRHADANVIAQTLPAMDEVELARFFGPATGLMCAPELEWAGGRKWLVADRPDGLPEPQRGNLRISLETVRQTEAGRLRRNQTRIAAYLRRVAPDQTRGMTDKTLSDLTARYMQEARSYGVRSEAGMGRWAYLQVLTEGRMGQEPSVHTLMTTKEVGVSPDQRVRLLLQQSADAVRRGQA